MQVERVPSRYRYQCGRGEVQSAVGLAVGLSDGTPVLSDNLVGCEVAVGRADVVGETVGMDVVGEAVIGDAVDTHSSNGFHDTEAQQASTEGWRASHRVARPPQGRPGTSSQSRTHLMQVDDNLRIERQTQMRSSRMLCTHTLVAAFRYQLKRTVGAGVGTSPLSSCSTSSLVGSSVLRFVGDAVATQSSAATQEMDSQHSSAVAKVSCQDPARPPQGLDGSSTQSMTHLLWCFCDSTGMGK